MSFPKCFLNHLSWHLNYCIIIELSLSNDFFNSIIRKFYFNVDFSPDLKIMFSPCIKYKDYFFLFFFFFLPTCLSKQKHFPNDIFFKQCSCFSTRMLVNSHKVNIYKLDSDPTLYNLYKISGQKYSLEHIRSLSFSTLSICFFCIKINAILLFYGSFILSFHKGQ